MATNSSKQIIMDGVDDLGFGAPKRGILSNAWNLGGINGSINNIVNACASTPQVNNPVDVVIISTPTMFSKRPDICRGIKTIFETCPTSITGIDFETTMGSADVAGGFDGQKHKMPTTATITQPNPVFKIAELPGNLLYNLLRLWLRNIRHPHTNHGYTDVVNDFDVLPPHVWSTFCMSMLVYQRDPSGLTDRIIEAAWYHGMWPNSTTPVGFERTMDSAKVIERDVNFNAVVVSNDETRDMAYRVADYIDATRLNMERIPLGVTNVSDNLKDMGLEKEIKEMREYAGSLASA